MNGDDIYNHLAFVNVVVDPSATTVGHLPRVIKQVSQGNKHFCLLTYNIPVDEHMEEGMHKRCPPCGHIHGSIDTANLSILFDHISLISYA